MCGKGRGRNWTGSRPEVDKTYARDLKAQGACTLQFLIVNFCLCKINFSHLNVTIASISPRHVESPSSTTVNKPALVIWNDLLRFRTGETKTAQVIDHWKLPGIAEKNKREVIKVWMAIDLLVGNYPIYFAKLQNNFIGFQNLHCFNHITFKFNYY